MTATGNHQQQKQEQEQEIPGELGESGEELGEQMDTLIELLTSALVPSRPTGIKLALDRIQRARKRDEIDEDDVRIIALRANWIAGLERRRHPDEIIEKTDPEFDIWNLDNSFETAIPGDDIPRHWRHIPSGNEVVVSSSNQLESDLMAEYRPPGTTAGQADTQYFESVTDLTESDHWEPVAQSE